MQDKIIVIQYFWLQILWFNLLFEVRLLIIIIIIFIFFGIKKRHRLREIHNCN